MKQTKTKDHKLTPIQKQISWGIVGLTVAAVTGVFFNKYKKRLAKIREQRELKMIMDVEAEMQKNQEAREQRIRELNKKLF